jgi:hypothetical protein
MYARRGGGGPRLHVSWLGDEPAFFTTGTHSMRRISARHFHMMYTAATGPAPVSMNGSCGASNRWRRARDRLNERRVCTRAGLLAAAARRAGAWRPAGELPSSSRPTPRTMSCAPKSTASSSRTAPGHRHGLRSRQSDADRFPDETIAEYMRRRATEERARTGVELPHMEVVGFAGCQRRAGY